MAESKPHVYKYPHPAVTVDLVIFTLIRGVLQLLLIKRGSEPFRGQWALPGGFVRIDEPLMHAAQRELREETGLMQGFLEQVAAFGDPNRDPRERVISIAFYAIIAGDKTVLQAGSDATQVNWYPVNELPSLAFDHHTIIEAARLKLADRIGRTTLALEFLPNEFTLTELQEVFEAVRGDAVDKRNFRKWAESLSFIKPTGKTRRGGQHRPAALFRASGKGVLPAPTVLDESKPASGVGENAAKSAAYRKGYEDALAAMHHAVVESQRTLLKAASSR